MSRGSHELGVDAAVGAMIRGIFGLAWAEWGASGLSGPAQVVVRVLGIVLGVVIIIRSVRLRIAFQRAGQAERAPSMFASRGYLLTVIAEVIAMAGGALVLIDTGRGDYLISWFAAVVGVHFVVFGRLFWSSYYWLGGALIAAGIAGAIVGVTDGSAAAITAVSGLVASVVMLVSGAQTVLAAGSSLRSSAPSHV